MEAMKNYNINQISQTETKAKCSATQTNLPAMEEREEFAKRGIWGWGEEDIRWHRTQNRWVKKGTIKKSVLKTRLK